jgi:hypothetical protein
MPGKNDDPSRREALERLRRALDEEPPRSRWIQVATVDENGVARLRTVVLHGIDDEARLSIATDAASRKVADLRRAPRAEACLLARRSLEQFRLLARFEIVDDSLADREPALGELRRRLWRALEPREKGYYVSPPAGLDRERFAPEAFHVECHDPEPVVRFCLLLGALEAVDFLDVSATPHPRLLFERGPGGVWSRRAITP